MKEAGARTSRKKLAAEAGGLARGGAGEGSRRAGEGRYGCGQVEEAGGQEWEGRGAGGCRRCAGEAK